MPHATITTNYDYDAPHRRHVVVRTLTRLLHAILSSCRFPTATCHTPFFIYDDSHYEGNHSGTVYAYDDHPAEAKTTFNIDYDDSRQLWLGRAQHPSESKLADVYDDQTPTSSMYHGTYIDEPIAKIESGATLYYHCNRKYDVAGLTDATGNIIELYAYTPYGTQTVLDASGFDIGLTAQNNPYGFTGRRFDEETGLWYFRARYFDSELGRFISRDPVGYVDGMSLYAGYFAMRFILDYLGLAERPEKPPGSFDNDYVKISITQYLIKRNIHGGELVQKMKGNCKKYFLIIDAWLKPTQKAREDFAVREGSSTGPLPPIETSGWHISIPGQDKFLSEANWTTRDINVDQYFRDSRGTYSDKWNLSRADGANDGIGGWLFANKGGKQYHYSVRINDICRCYKLSIKQLTLQFKFTVPVKKRGKDRTKEVILQHVIIPPIQE